MSEFTVIEILDRDDPSRPVGVEVWVLHRSVGISNTTERAVRIVVGGEELVLWPSPRRAESAVVGILLWRSAGRGGEDFDFRVVGESLVDPVPLDGLVAELLLPGDVPCERPH